jgi:hypothetical protein
MAIHVFRIPLRIELSKKRKRGSKTNIQQQQQQQQQNDQNNDSFQNGYGFTSNQNSIKKLIVSAYFHFVKPMTNFLSALISSAVIVYLHFNGSV